VQNFAQGTCFSHAIYTDVLPELHGSRDTIKGKNERGKMRNKDWQIVERAIGQIAVLVTHPKDQGKDVWKDIELEEFRATRAKSTRTGQVGLWLVDTERFGSFLLDSETAYIRDATAKLVLEKLKTEYPKLRVDAY